MRNLAILWTVVVLMVLCACALIAYAGTTQRTKFVRVHDGYRVHERWLNASGNVLGEYYEVEHNDFRAQCYPNGDPLAFATAEYARRYVLTCEVWQ